MRHSFLIFIFFILAGCTPTIYVHNIPNFAQVEQGIWRSGQPVTDADWLYLKSIGVNHVIKLNFESEGTDNGATKAGLTVHVLSIQPEGDKDIFDNISNTFVAPNSKNLDAAEAILEAGGGVLIHCTHGEDRTSLGVGRFRVLHDKWTKDKAYQEMLQHHFHPELHGLHEYWENFHP
ncbi:MAG TPA: tyrosine-protein phosphatase [Methylobacter sp.]|jgi:protein tyrosine/serine phosphatase